MRDFVVTNQAIYNFGSKITGLIMSMGNQHFKRRIELSKISLSISETSKLFIIHEDLQRDYLLELDFEK
jgi:hypothetical protein